MKKEKTLDMTRGSILRHLITFSIPMIIGNVFQQLYNMVDTIIVGRTVGMDALAAVGTCGVLVFCIIGFATGLTNGFTIITSQRFGAGDENGVRRSVATGAVLSIVFAVILTLFSVLAAKWMLRLMNTPEEVFDQAYQYFIAICWGVPVTMFYNYLSSVLRALGDSKTPLFFLLIASVLNIILDFVFILNFHMGTQGAGVATVVSQAVSGILCLFYIMHGFPILRLKRRDWKMHKNFTLLHLQMGIPMACQVSIISFGGIAVQSKLNSFGTIAMAGYAAAGRIEQLVSQVMVSLGMTLATFVGQNYGAGNLPRIKQGVKITCILMGCLAVVGAIVIFFFGRALTMIFISAEETNVEAVINYSRQYMNLSCFFYPALGAIFVFRNTLQGIGNTGIVLVGSAVELIARLVGAIVLAIPFGYLGVCFAGPMAWLGAAILFVTVYFVDIHKLHSRMSLSHKNVA